MIASDRDGLCMLTTMHAAFSWVKGSTHMRCTTYFSCPAVTLPVLVYFSTSIETISLSARQEGAGIITHNLQRLP